VIHADPTVAPLAGPACEVVTVAKRPLKTGEHLDGVGGFCAYGLIENHSTARTVDALPIALSDDCVLLRDIGRDEVVTFKDVKMPSERLRDKLWSEQHKRWPTTARGDVAPEHRSPQFAAIE
jgi:predicted homoserine dehydrogenase-like protein